MYLYNITLIIETGVESRLIASIQSFLKSNSQEAMGPHPRLLRMLDSQHEGATYCLQLETGSRDGVQRFQEGDLPRLQNQLEADFPGKVLYFESLMERV